MVSSAQNPIGVLNPTAFDPRIVRLGIELDDGFQYFENLYINARGTLYGNGTLNECEVVIYNLTRAQQNYLISQTSPFNLNRTAKLMTIDVGRESTGTFRLYQGNVIAAGMTQPPDIGIVLRGLTGAFLLGNIISVNQPALSKLSTISQQVAENTGTSLVFEATDKNISNYSFSGPVINQVGKLSEAGNIDAFIDNNTLVVKNKGQPLTGGPRIINSSTGMVGIPEVDELGVSVRCMIDSSIKLGASVTIESEMNPAAKGTFTTYKLDFEVANREDPFWYNIWASNYLLT